MNAAVRLEADKILLWSNLRLGRSGGFHRLNGGLAGSILPLIGVWFLSSSSSLASAHVGERDALLAGPAWC